MPDYRAAAKRHFDDAELLHQQARLANADHLYGFSAECALKAVMQGLGMPMNAAGTAPAAPHKKHIDVLWDLSLTFMNGHNGMKFSGMLSASNPFVTWTVEDRYEDGVTCVQSVVAAHQNGAQEAYNCLSQAILDGVV